MKLHDLLKHPYVKKECKFVDMLQNKQNKIDQLVNYCQGQIDKLK